MSSKEEFFQSIVEDMKSRYIPTESIDKFALTAMLDAMCDVFLERYGTLNAVFICLGSHDGEERILNVDSVTFSPDKNFLFSAGHVLERTVFDRGRDE